FSGAFGGQSTSEDFSTSYTYDMQGNIRTLTRQGLIAPNLFGCIDDMTATFRGNQLVGLRDDADDVLLESSLDLRSGTYGSDAFDYDANGNQTRDMSRGVAEVVYNALNLPQSVTMEDGSTISYLYSADGTKLAEIVCDAQGDTISRRDFVGSLEYVNGMPDRLSVEGGYITIADTTFHACIPDYQGNIVAVYNTATQTLEQTTDYYPYGLPHATSTNPATNRHKYGAKELQTDLGLNLYDFEARYQNPVLPHFTTPDPLATDYHPISPYTYCAADPINLIDPSGMKFDLSFLNVTQSKQWQATVESMCNSSSLMKVLYDFLNESDNVYTIYGVVSTQSSNSESQACFIAGEVGGVIEIRNEKLAEEALPRNSIAEELFHAFQSEVTYENEANREFEAKIFLSAYDTEVGIGALGDADCISISYYRDLIQASFQDGTNPLLSLGNMESEPFKTTYFYNAILYIEYCKEKNNFSPNYTLMTKDLPRALIRLNQIYNQ
ncbi:MAG: RHS repeat-associated core domain-containing protein, partial [Bacteroides sp.]|nr:RHS repeat-associated core domain-containing protein [Bacteroides sp.]MCM1413990.1 RHS repeat-associated core domain-containing protein [Bacteroides sp.]